MSSLAMLASGCRLLFFLLFLFPTICCRIISQHSISAFLTAAAIYFKQSQLYLTPQEHVWQCVGLFENATLHCVK